MMLKAALPRYVIAKGSRHAFVGSQMQVGSVKEIERSLFETCLVQKVSQQGGLCWLEIGPLKQIHKAVDPSVLLFLVVYPLE